MEIATGVLVQPVGPGHRPVTFLSKQLDPTAKRWQTCLRALAAAACLAKESLKLTFLQAMTVYSSHHLQDLLTPQILGLSQPITSAGISPPIY